VFLITRPAREICSGPIFGLAFQCFGIKNHDTRKRTYCYRCISKQRKNNPQTYLHNFVFKMLPETHLLFVMPDVFSRSYSLKIKVHVKTRYIKVFVSMQPYCLFCLSNVSVASPYSVSLQYEFLKMFTYTLKKICVQNMTVKNTPITQLTAMAFITLNRSCFTVVLM